MPAPITPTWFNGTVQQHLTNDWRTWTLIDPHATPALQKSTLEGWFIGILPDLNQNDPEVARYLIQNSLWWIGRTGSRIGAPCGVSAPVAGSIASAVTWWSLPVGP